MIKKIKLLTNIFFKDYYQNLNIINKKNKLNKKSVFAWLLIIFIFALMYLSLKVISFLQNIGIPILFLKIYLPIMATIMITQLIPLICRIFYYSKDLEYILPLPVKTTEILIAKLNTVIIIMYLTEALFLLVPMIMYGMLEAQTISFFVSMIIALIFFPILFTTIISIIMLFVMKLSKLIKNQDIFQTAIVSILSFIIIFAEMSYIEQIIFKKGPEDIEQIKIVQMKIDEINNAFLIINPLIEILNNNKFIYKLINFIKILIINIIPIIIFILIGNKLYLKNILQNKNKIRKIKRKNKYKQKNKIIQYIKNDIKNIIKNPTFFIQYIFQYLFIAMIGVILLNLFIPTYMDELRKTNIVENIGLEAVKLQATLIVIGIIQLIFTFSNLSITAISRQGKNAQFMKYIPISLYKQFKLKAIPQIFLNLIVIFMILTTIYLKIPEITIEYYIIAFLLAIILNIINSYIMLLIDLKKPNLNWVNEESISKNNGNKLYQYVYTIFSFLILMYFSNIFENISFIISILSIVAILILILIFIKKYIKNNINKIFSKII